MRWMIEIGILVGLVLLNGARLSAGEADVVSAEAELADDGSYKFIVTVRHGDEGWEHYADRWDVLAPDGTVIAERVLYHPHVDEQPFSRSLSGIAVPAEISTVTIRAHDSVHGQGGAVSVRLPGR